MTSDNREIAVPTLAGRREWVGLGVLAIACLVYVMDLTVLHLAVPKLSADLQPTSSQSESLGEDASTSAVSSRSEMSDDPIPALD